MPVDDPERVVRLRTRFDLDGPRQLVDRLRQAIGAPEHERQVVAREGMPGIELQHAAEARDRFRDVLLRLRQAQREVAIRIVGCRGDQGARALRRFGSFPGLDQRENQVVGRLLKVRALGHRSAVGVDGGVERADSLERLPEPVLDVGVTGRQSRGFPQKRERRRGVPLGLELDRPRVCLLRASRCFLRRAENRRRPKNRDEEDRQPPASSRHGAHYLTGVVTLISQSSRRCRTRRPPDLCCGPTGTRSASHPG